MSKQAAEAALAKYREGCEELAKQLVTELLNAVEAPDSNLPTPPSAPTPTTLFRALVTGSRAYGTPRNGDCIGWDETKEEPSDTDLVVWVSPEDMKILASQGEQVSSTSDKSDGAGEISTASLRFGNLNLIVCTQLKDFEIWRDGTAFLKTKAPVSRDKATQYLRKKRAKL